MAEISMEELCRICLKESYFISNIYNEQLLDGTRIFEVVNDLLQLDVEFEDGYPQFLCSECYDKVIEFELFKRTAHEGKAVLLYSEVSFENSDIESEDESAVCGVSVPVKTEVCLVSSEVDSNEAVSVLRDPLEVYLTPVKVEDYERVPAGNDPLEVGKDVSIKEEEIFPDENDLFVEEDVPQLKSEVIDIEEELLERVSSTPVCLQEENVTNSEIVHSNQEYREVDINITKNFRGERSLGKKKFDVNFKVHETSIHQKEATGEDCMQSSEFVNYYGVNLNRNNEQSAIGNTDGDNRTLRNQLEHHVSIHNEVRQFQCSICSKSFSQKSSLLRHTNLHSDERPHVCNVCGKSFKAYSYLTEHMKAHSKWSLYRCEVCGKVFPRKSSLNNHTKLHSSYNPFSCVTCGLSFKCEITLRQHVINHSVAKPFCCKLCGKDFADIHEMRNHQLTHRYEKTLTCYICSKSFKTSESLRVHVYSHKGLKHKCSICSKEFNLKWNLKVHMQTHSALKLFPCPGCGSTFKYLSTMKYHLRFHCKAK